MENHNSFPRARWIKIAIVAAVWLLFAGVFARQWSGDSQVWKRLFGVPPMSGQFADLSQIPAAVLCVQHGLDPYQDNPYDVDHRPFVYPHLWISLFAALRITPERSIPAGIVLAFSFLAAVSWSIFRQRDLWAAAFLGLVACSSASAFAMERGNTDILMFCLLILAIKFESRGGVWFLVVATVMKVYPFFSLLGQAFLGRRTKLLYLALAIGATGIFLQHRDFVSRDNNASHGYGIREIDIAMESAPRPMRAAFEAHPGAFRAGFEVGLALLCASGAMVGLMWGHKYWRRKDEGNRVTAEIDGRFGGGLSKFEDHRYEFLLSASIFVGTFLTSTSYAYRLIFLMPLVPLLVGQVRGAARLPRVLAACGLCLILFGVNRGIAEMVSWRPLAGIIKVAVHLDLWALLWVVGFFLGLIAMRQYTEARQGRTGAAGLLRVGLTKESA